MLSPVPAQLAAQIKEPLLAWDDDFGGIQPGKQTPIAKEKPSDIANQVARREEAENAGHAALCHRVGGIFILMHPAHRAKDSNLVSARAEKIAAVLSCTGRRRRRDDEIMALVLQQRWELEPEWPLRSLGDDGGPGKHLGRERALIPMAVHLD